MKKNNDTITAIWFGVTIAILSLVNNIYFGYTNVMILLASAFINFVACAVFYTIFSQIFKNTDIYKAYPLISTILFSLTLSAVLNLSIAYIVNYNMLLYTTELVWILGILIKAAVMFVVITINED
jgi:hypothetical protein